MSVTTRMVSATLAATAAALSVAASANAATTASWSCRGSAVEVQVATNDRLAPILSERTPCADSSNGLPRTAEAVGLAPALTAQSAYARTSAQLPTAFPKDQRTAADAGVEGLELKLLDGALTIGVDAARSAAGASCVAGVPQFAGVSTVAGLKINGQAVVLDGLLSSIVDPISASPLGAIVQVKLNEQIKNDQGIIQRAAHVIVLPGAVGGAPLADVVIAESLVGSVSACDPTATNNNPPGGDGDGSGNGTGTPVGGADTGSDDGFPRVCPSGSSLDRDRGLCVISAAASQGQGIVVIGRPFSGPSGGRVVSLTRARKQFKSPCLQGSGAKYAIIGTNKRDSITGTNKSDRILARGGNDDVGGGRGNDCMDGGTGGDNLSGSIGKDRIYGMVGKDHLNGGPGADRLSGGSGNDTINAAFGQDRVFGGSGRDFINVATAGKPARVNCGSGPDKVRVNSNEQRRVRGCETMFVLRD